MRLRHRSGTRGSNLVEFTLVGIPMIFVLISIFELARGMWTYVTLANALRDANRYAIVHGHNCLLAPSYCPTTIGAISQRLADSGVGLLRSNLRNIEFRSASRTVPCADLTACLASTTPWPANPSDPNDAGALRLADIEIRAQYGFESVLVLFWPGAGTVSFGDRGLIWFSANSRERIQY